MAWCDTWTPKNVVLEDAEKMVRDVHVDENLVAKLHDFMKEKGVFGIMPVGRPT